MKLDGWAPRTDSKSGADRVGNVSSGLTGGGTGAILSFGSCVAFHNDNLPCD